MSKDLTMQDLENHFKYLMENNYSSVIIMIQIEGYPLPEIIVNPRANMQKKLEYYKASYNNDLTLKTFSGIRIIGLDGNL